MTLHQLRIFKSVSKYLNITRAAAALHVSQPSISQQLRLLEDEFRIKLYEKVGQGIRLTEAYNAPPPELKRRSLYTVAPWPRRKMMTRFGSAR